MERLTVKRVDGRWALDRKEGCSNMEQFEQFPIAINKLAAYENTGLEPEEISSAFNEVAITKLMARYLGTTPERLTELVQADKDGRALVLPCKVGDWVYRVYSDCTLPGDCYTKRMCKGCEYRNIFIEKQPFSLSMLRGNGAFGHPYYRTREEAEKALKGENKDE